MKGMLDKQATSHDDPPEAFRLHLGQRLKMGKDHWIKRLRAMTICWMHLGSP